jgi:SMODS-associating 2TM, beta-strand rich effector domain
MTQSNFKKITTFIAAPLITTFIYKRIFNNSIDPEITDFIISILITLFVCFLFWFFNNYLWKIDFFAELIDNFVGIPVKPNINGVYLGKVYSSYEYDYKNNQYTMIVNTLVVIKQTYFNTMIKQYNFNEDFSISSKSHLNNGIYFSQTISNDNTKKWKVFYDHINNVENNFEQEKSSFNERKEDHIGVTLINEVTSNPHNLKGIYTNDETRKTRGKFDLRRNNTKYDEHYLFEKNYSKERIKELFKTNCIS